MDKLEKVFMRLETELEKNARERCAKDVERARLRLMGYIDGVKDMRILLSRYLKEQEKETVQEKEVEDERYDTDLIREIVNMHEKIKAILLLLKQIDFLGGDKDDVSKIFGKDC